MDVLDQLEAVATGHLDRRAFTAGLSALGITAVAFGPKSARAATDPPPYYTWYGYEEEAIHSEFLKLRGNVPRIAFFSDMDEAFSKLQTGFRVDFTHSEAFYAPTWRDAGLFEPIPRGSLKHLPDVFPALYDMDWNNVDDAVWFVPFDWGFTSVLFRNDLYTPPVKNSWDILWDPSLAGRIGASASFYDSWMSGALKAGIGREDIARPESIEKTAAALREQHSLVRTYFDNPSTMERAVANKEVVAALAWNSSALALADAGYSISFANPPEGKVGWVGGIMLSRECADPALAIEAIDSMLSPKAGQFIIAEYGYGHANRKSYETFTPEFLQALGVETDLERALNTNFFPSPQSPDWYADCVNRFESIRLGF